MSLLQRRTPSPEHNNYRHYKIYLREDFHYICVYCQAHENEWGGPRSFTVEHFRPKGLPRFTHLTNDYRNLLYACQVCNSYKSNDWPSDNPLLDDKGYLDPCEHDYEGHFRVLETDQIHGLTGVGRYMVEKLHLNRKWLVDMRRARQQSEIQH